MTAEASRRCYRCKVIKPLTDFPVGNSKPLGRDYRCRDCAREQNNAAYHANPDRHKESKARYYQKNRDRILAQTRAYKRANPEVVARSAALRRQRIRDNGVYVVSPRDERWLSTAPCYYCGCLITGPRHIDHVIPVSRGGTTGIGNLVPVCVECSTGQNGKHARFNSEWFYRHGKPPHFMRGKHNGLRV